MTDDERELVGMIELTGLGTIRKDMAEKILSVVKANLGKIAEACKDCRHEGDIGVRNRCICSGTGIVPKGKQ